MRLKLLGTLLLIALPPVLCQHSLVNADEPKADFRIEAPEAWRGETIKLPPGFAKDMKLTGVEKIRFAPGMFKAKAEDFFSYVLVFRLEGQPDISTETLQSELLKYYRGLAKSVSQGKIATDGFSLEIGAAATAKPQPYKQHNAKLQWTEPFATGKDQTLLIELQVWSEGEQGPTWMVMCVSPAAADAPIWGQMHKIRDAFLADHLRKAQSSTP